MLVIGLCGGSGSGKSTVTKKFEKYGIVSIDADKVYRELLFSGSALLLQLKNAFGDKIINDDGTLNKKELSAIVFSNYGKAHYLPVLNSITHAAIIFETERRIEEFRQNGSIPAVIFDAPLLFEAGFDKKCDIIIAVTADTETRIERIMMRDNITKEQAQQRISAQLSDEFLIEHADYVIVNNGSAESLENRVSELAEYIFK